MNPKRDDLRANDELSGILQSAFGKAQGTWPEIELPYDDFCRHLGRHVSEQDVAIGDVPHMPMGDLYLALACARGDEAALRVLQRDFLAPLTQRLRGNRSLARWTDDGIQALREKLLVPTKDKAARIETFAGQGPLMGWLRMAALRSVADLQRRDNKLDGPVFDGIDRSAADISDPEMLLLKRKYSADVEAAFAAVLRDLDKKQRLILRMHHLDGLNAEAIGTAMDVSKRTVERWLAATREAILRETRRHLAERLQVSVAELDTLMGLVQSQFHPDLRGLLIRQTKQPG